MAPHRSKENKCWSLSRGALSAPSTISQVLREKTPKPASFGKERSHIPRRVKENRGNAQIAQTCHGAASTFFVTTQRERRNISRLR
jgi:hypothetical protein